MGKVTVVGGKVGMEAPGKGIALSTIAEGSIVKSRRTEVLWSSTLQCTTMNLR